MFKFSRTTVMFITVMFITVMFITVMFILGLIVNTANAISVEQTLFEVDFNDLTVGDFLGEGGSAVGEPSRLNDLTAEVFEESIGNNVVNVSYTGSATSTRRINWDFLDGEEISEGIITIAFRFTPSSRDNYSHIVREANGFSQNFLTLTYSTSGVIFANDEAGSITLINNTYNAGEEQNIVMTFDMDAETSSLTINNNELYINRSHGIIDPAVGSFSTGYGSGGSFSPFDFDNFVVSVDVELPLVLDVDFEDKTVGEALGTGGAAANEPVTISSNLFNEIIEDGPDNQSVYLEKITGTTQSARWQFIDNLEFNSGWVAIEFDIEFAAIDRYRILLRESGTAAFKFSDIGFAQSGLVNVTDSTGFIDFIGTYEANVKYTLKLVFDMDSGKYSVFIDDDMVLENRDHGVSSGRGIGSLLTSFQSNASDNSTYIVDNIRVAASEYSDLIFSDGFDKTPGH